MVTLKVQTRDDVKKVLKKAQRGNIESLGQASAYARAVMRNTIGRKKKPRDAGQPATSPTGRGRRAIAFAVEGKAGVSYVGPRFDKVGKSLSAHEFGGKYKGDYFAPRPFALPTLGKVGPRLGKFWQGTIR